MRKNIYQGKFIVFEGLDGSGLSTQAKLLKEYLENKRIKTVLTKEPTKNSSIASKIHQALGHRIKVDPLQLQELFAQDRREHLENLIIPSLKEGKFVISDRYFFSSFAFGSEKEEDLEKIIELNKDFLMPDLVLLLKVRPKVCIERIKKRGEEIKLFEKEKKLKKVWINYQKLSDMFNVIRIIDGERKVEDVYQEVIKIVDKIL